MKDRNEFRNKGRGGDFRDKRRHDKPDFKEHHPPRNAHLKDISIANKGESFFIRVLVDRIVQTGGPTVFYVLDGTGSLAIKAFEKAGVRAHPHISEGDAVEAVIVVKEFNDGLEGEVKRIRKLEKEEKEEFKKGLERLERERAKVIPIPFLVESAVLEKLKDSLIKAATEIKLAIFQNRPIVIRHHNDTDGYSAGYALERAILPLITNQHSSSVKAAWELYTRAPCNAPMYEIDDSIRDTAHSLSNVAKFSNKMPLIIIVDTGSGEEDLLGIKQGKVHGIDFIVVDHHAFVNDVISDEVLVHINPFLVGENGSNYSAGMLCTELARFINPVETIVQIPAMAGMADRVDNPDVIEGYLKHVAKKGYDKKLLGDIATVIDFVSSKLRFMEAREFIEVVFGEPMEKQKRLVALLAPYIRDLEAKGLKIAESAAKHEKIKDVHFQTIEIEKVFPRGFYPKPGKCISALHDAIQEKKNLNKVVTIGILDDAMTMRGTDEANFSVSELIEYLDREVPDAFVEGGGHKNAGSIKFTPLKKDEVLKEVREFIKKRN